MLEADRARIADIEAKILDLERSISELRADKALVQHRLDSYKYPVLTLPNEIVSEIFVHFLPIYPQYPPFSGTLSPTVLTQVCHEWREIALATPALWSAISLTTSAVPPFERQLHISEIWLHRSRRSPLSIQIIDNSLRSRGPEIFAAVVDHQARCEHLKLHLVRSPLPALGEVFPLLRHLDLRLTTAVDVFTLHHAPLLRTVSLNVGGVHKIVLPWAQLTSLQLCFIYPSEYVPILQQTPNLVDCKLDIFFGGESDQPDITLPCVKALVLDNRWNEPLADGLLSTFLVPALQRLEISERILMPNPIQSLASFITKSSCQLREVHITGSEDYPLSVPEDTYREAFPSIQPFFFSGYRQEMEIDWEVESGSSDGESD
ncbi:hypothetical protein B0H19DRAFT_232880 [Mycena capillaripes]|nr:hypothetical protein B0H19DRAFT_232880 [Mycena capillaripes]